MSPRGPTDDRRQFLKAAIFGSTVAATEILAPQVAVGESPVPAPAPAAPQASPGTNAASIPFTPAYTFLRPPEADFVEALADHMVPADHLTPSGTDLGVTVYMDRALQGGWGQGEGLYLGGPWQVGTPSQGYQSPLTPAQFFRTGLEAVEAALAKDGRPSFARQDPAAKDALLHELEEGRLDTVGVMGSALFALLYQLVVEGLFADPIYGGNREMAGWKMVGFPGVIATHSHNITTYKDRPYPVNYLSITDVS